MSSKRTWSPFPVSRSPNPGLTSYSVRHSRAVQGEIRKVSVMNEEELYAYAKEIQAPFHLLKETARLKRLPVVNFAAGGIATPGAFL